MDYDKDDTEIKSYGKKLGWSIFNITVEPILISTMLASGLTNGAKIDFQRLLICQQLKEISTHSCTSNLTEQEYEFVNGKTAQLQAASVFVNSLGPIVMALFIGPWSDINGRKPFLFAATLGLSLHYALWGLMSLGGNVEPFLILALSLPASITGGLMTIMVCCYSYLGDAHSDMNKALRFTLGIGGMQLGTMLASISAAPLFSSTSPYGYQSIFFLATGISALNMIYVMYSLPESIDLKPGRERKFFNINNIKNVADVVFKRPRYEVVVVILTISILIGELAPSSGNSAVLYLVGKSEYDWSLSKFNYFILFTDLVGIISSPLLSLVFKKLLNIQDMWTICILSIVSIAGNWMKACAQKEIHFWIGGGIVKLNTVTVPLIMSALSDIAPKNHSGIIYSLVSLLESVAPVIFSFLYSSIFKSLVNSGGKTVIVYMISIVIASYVTVTSGIIQIIKSRFNQGEYNLKILPL